MKNLFGAIALLMFATTFAPAGASQPDVAPLYSHADWLNGSLDAAALRGKVVIADIFTFDCINCKHVVPNLRALYSAQHGNGLAIVGVHAPETSYERSRTNVVANLRAQGIDWPVRIDNDFRVWKAFDIQYWPTQLIFDKRGRLRKTIIGEGQDADLNATVRALLKEPG